MASTRALRILLSAVACGLVAVTAGAPASVAAQHIYGRPPADTADAKPSNPKMPPPPQLPADFQGRGRYIVRDLGVNVPFTWDGRGGDSQMVAGGPDYPIWFTNLIYHNTLYTLTYKWPNVHPPHNCSKIPGVFSRDLVEREAEDLTLRGRGDPAGLPEPRMSITGASASSAASPNPEKSSGSRSPWATFTLTRPIRASGGRFCSSASRTSSILSWTNGSGWPRSTRRPARSRYRRGAHPRPREQ